MNNPNISRLVLLKTSLENDYKHTLWFGDPKADNTKTDQTNYFLSKKFGRFDFTNLTYIRKDHSIKIPAHYDSVVGANYAMYQNKSTTKWYYAFITDIKYISEGVTELVLETDVIQTWMFAYSVLPSFVEREHVDNDMIGKHTYPENVELGEYICNRKVQVAYSGVATATPSENEHMWIVVGVTQYKVGNSWADVRGERYTNVYSAVKYYVFPTNEDGYEDLRSFIINYDSGHAEAIQCIFLAPKVLIPSTSVNGDHSLKNSAVNNIKYINNYKYAVLQPATSDNNQVKLTKDVLDGYTPRNNKLMTFPYRYLNVSNNNGTSVQYMYEHFNAYNTDGILLPVQPSFVINGCLTPGCSVRMTPQFYKGVVENDDESINLGKFPVCNWSSDLYTNWLTQNGVNIGMDIAGGVINTALGVGLMGTGAGALVGGSVALSGLTQIGNTIGQLHQMSFTPPQVKGNINNGDVITASGRNDFHFYDMSIKSEYAKIIDGYFDMFGYKVCKVKTPSTDHRERYWYIKTIDVNIDGGVPQKDLQKIKDVYNNGVTFWKYNTSVGLYPYYENGELQASNFIDV